MIRRLRVAFAAGILVASAAPAAAAVPDTAVTTVYLVRHAEKNSHAPGGDSGLTMKGIARAEDLVRTLKDARLDVVYATPFARAQLTAEPIARAIGDSVRTYDANYPEVFGERIRIAHRGATILVVGHTDTLILTLRGFLGIHLDAETIDYDRLFVAQLGPGGQKRLLRLRYGAAP